MAGGDLAPFASTADASGGDAAAARKALAGGDGGEGGAAEHTNEPTAGGDGNTLPPSTGGAPAAAPGAEKRGRGRPKGSKTQRLTGAGYDGERARVAERQAKAAQDKAATLAAENAALRAQTSGEARESLEAMAAGLVDLGCNIASAVWGEHLKAKPEDRAAVAAPFARYMLHAAPGAAESSPLFGLLIALGAVVGGKVGEHRKALAQVDGDAARLLAATSTPATA